MPDPVSKEIGKTLIFCVSQNHAAKVTNILNIMADTMFPGKYQSDFTVQVTSNVSDAQQHTTNFTNNRLRGSGNFLDLYKTSKARVCVTVGMMTTTDPEFRDIIENRKYALLNTNPNGEVFRKLPAELRNEIPEYIKDNVSINKFTA